MTHTHTHTCRKKERLLIQGIKRLANIRSTDELTSGWNSAKAWIWCIFLLLFGADNIENSFNTEGLTGKKLKDYHDFFKSIEKEMEDKILALGKR